MLHNMTVVTEPGIFLHHGIQYRSTSQQDVAHIVKTTLT